MTGNIEIKESGIFRIEAVSGVVYSQKLSDTSVRQLHMNLLIPKRSDGVVEVSPGIAPTALNGAAVRDSNGGRNFGISGLRPAVVYFPGGGFLSSRPDRYVQLRMALAEAGFVVASVEYRTVPDRFPAMVEDGRTAVRFLRAHAPGLGIDPGRIGVLGHSAGGYLAMMTGFSLPEDGWDGTEWRYAPDYGGIPAGEDCGKIAAVSSQVQAVASIYGISDLRDIGADFPAEVQRIHHSPAAAEALMLHGAAYKDFPGASITEDPQAAFAASPAAHVRSGLPPVLLMHGTSDTLVSPSQTARMHSALEAAGVPVDYYTVAGAGHGGPHWLQPEVIGTIVDWFRRVLR